MNLKGFRLLDFFNFITDKEELLPMVEDALSTNFPGGFIFKVTQKLKLLKKPCRSLFRNHDVSGKRMQDLRKVLDDLQGEIDKDPFNASIREEHAKVLFEYNEVCEDEEKLLFQELKSGG